MANRYRDLNSYLRELFGCRVQKISLDAGFTCPNRDGTLATGGCIYCNSRGSGTGAHARKLSITAQLEQGKAWISQRYNAKKFIAYFQSFSNTYAPIEILARCYREALSVSGVVGLSIGTRPDCVSRPVMELLASFTPEYLVWMEYGLQSAQDKTLVRINRGHTLNDFYNAIKLTREYDIKICVHVILGLPGETSRDILATARILSDLGIDGIKLHLLYVVKGTLLEKEYTEGRYRCLEQMEYVDLVCRFLELLPPEVVIQRLTGDPHPEELLAPAWALERNTTLSLIKKKLDSDNSWQGKARKI